MVWGGAPNTNSFDGPHAYYWFDGLPFNRPVVVCLHKGSGISVGPSGDAPPWQELNADFPNHPDCLWRPHWPKGRWAGPIQQPK